ncbi:MAG: ABC transporter substrate-binding protein [Sphingomonadales bacterium]|nr:ABC transporter substrate-binding protein [Sphingomonadales bacterium]
MRQRKPERHSMKHVLFLAAALAAPAAVHAQAADPALDTVHLLDNGLLGIMRAGSGAGLAGRARQIGPVIDRAFDIPLMTRLSVGPAWNSFSASDQQTLVSAFRALTVAQYAKNFDAYGGERFNVVPQVETRGIDKLVRTTLGGPGDTPEVLNYRLRQSGGQWKIIDVYYRNAISQLATRRSDFAAVVAKGGAPALIQHLNRLAANPK